MKINIKSKDFSDKEKLEKTLNNKLKKPLDFLTKQVGQSLPFYYEAEYFDSGAGFLAIGESKELHRIFKMQRVKGKGEEGKIDKKKVALGTVALNQEGIYEFVVADGLMKKMQAKTVIKSINILKKYIGDKFSILGNAPIDDNVGENTTEETVSNPDSSTEEGLPQKLEVQLSQIQTNIEKLQKFIGKQPKEKLLANLEKFNTTLSKWKTQFQDNSVALEAIENAYTSVQETAEQVENAPVNARKKLSKEQRTKINANLTELTTQVETLLKELNSLDI